jgi:hypothetical protein
LKINATLRREWRKWPKGLVAISRDHHMQTSLLAAPSCNQTQSVYAQKMKKHCALILLILGGTSPPGSRMAHGDAAQAALVMRSWPSMLMNADTIICGHSAVSRGSGRGNAVPGESPEAVAMAKTQRAKMAKQSFETGQRLFFNRSTLLLLKKFIWTRM